MDKVLIILGIVVFNFGIAFAEDFCSKGYEVQSSKIVDGQNCVSYTCKGDNEVKTSCSDYGASLGMGIGVGLQYSYQYAYMGGYGAYGGLDPQMLEQYKKQQKYYQEQTLDESVCVQECKYSKNKLECKIECREKLSKERWSKRFHSLENCKMSDDERFISCPNGEYEKKSSTIETLRSDSPVKEPFNSKRNSNHNKSVIKE